MSNIESLIRRLDKIQAANTAYTVEVSFGGCTDDESPPEDGVIYIQFLKDDPHKPSIDLNDRLELEEVKDDDAQHTNEGHN